MKRCQRVALANEIRASPLRRWEVEVGEIVDHAAIGLLGEGLPFVVRAKAGLDVRDGNAAIERRERRSERRRRIALDDHPRWVALLDHAGCALERRGGEPRKRLARRHEVEIVIRGDVEQLEDRTQHLAVLSGDTDLDIEPRGARRANYRSELDRFGAGAEDDEEAGHYLRRTTIASRPLGRLRAPPIPGARCAGPAWVGMSAGTAARRVATTSMQWLVH